MRFKNEIIFLWEDENEVYVKSVPGDGYYAKFPGGKEFKIAHGTDSVAGSRRYGGSYKRGI